MRERERGEKEKLSCVPLQTEDEDGGEATAAAVAAATEAAVRGCHSERERAASLLAAYYFHSPKE